MREAIRIERPAVKPAREGILQRRLLVVAGKGGVGKTSIACALGVAAAQLGKRALLAEVDGAGRAAQLLGVEPAPVGKAQPVNESLSVISLEGSAALAEYLRIILPVKRVLEAVFTSRIYQYFVAAAPGLKELMTIGKIWYEAERRDEHGRRCWDIVIMDAPATGHSLQYLRMPRAAYEAFGDGLVRRESQLLIDLLTDPERCAVNLVTTAEEMPVNETIEMYRQIVNELQLPLGCLFVNRTHHADFRGKDVDRLQQSISHVHNPNERALVEEVISRGREEVGWSEIHQRYLRRLTDEVSLPVIEVPFMFAEEFGAAQVRAIAAELPARLTIPARRSYRHGRA